MILIEVFTPAGALPVRQRRTLASALVDTLLPAANGPKDLCYVVFRESDVFVGGQPQAPDAPVHYLVRVNVPGKHMTGTMRAETVTRITKALASVDSEPARLTQTAVAWVHIVEVPDGNMGVFGTPAHIRELVGLALDPDRRPPVATPRSEAVPEVVDPICGMTVPLVADAIRLERDGEVIGFCSHGCRDAYLAREGHG